MLALKNLQRKNLSSSFIPISSLAQLFLNWQIGLRKEYIDLLVQFPMILLNGFKNLLISFLPKPDWAWWVEIVTTEPCCIYYFGPFDNSAAAGAACPGYVEDLENEQAQGIGINIKYCKPDLLTVFDE